MCISERQLLVVRNMACIFHNDIDVTFDAVQHSFQVGSRPHVSLHDGAAINRNGSKIVYVEAV